MYTDKITQAVAEAVKQILATEKLHPNQQKLDVHEPEKDELTSNDFKMLRKGKKADVKEANNPFDVKNYKSQLPTKPGELAGFDSKKISTGTVYTRKPVKDEKPMKEDLDINAINGVKMSTVDESSHQAKTTMKHIPNASPELKKAAKDIKPGIAGFRDRIAMLKAGGVKE
jgi:hypothetical protein